MKRNVKEIKKLLGLISVDKQIFSIFFPKSEIPVDQSVFVREGSKDQRVTSNQILSIIKDCEFIKKRFLELSLVAQTEDVLREIDLNSFVFERKIEELVFLINKNFSLFSDYFSDKSKKEVLVQFFNENNLPEGVRMMEELNLNLE